jgi:hypothetical protein
MRAESSRRTVASRRQFLGELTASAAALATVACAPAVSTAVAGRSSPPASRPAAPAPASPARPTWDTSWIARITAKHKAVFDSPEIEYGAALYHAFSYLQAVRDVFEGSDADASLVIVLRHSAAPMLYNDAMWSKYEIGKDTKTTDSRTRKPALRNTFWQAVDAKGNPSTSTRPSATIKSLMSRGVSFIGCDLATRGYSYALARKD